MAEKSDLRQQLIDPDPKDTPSKHRQRLLDKSCCSKMAFGHLSQIVERGKKQPYQYDMLFKLDDSWLSADFPIFRRFYEENRERYKEDFLGLVLKYNSKYLWIAWCGYIFRYAISYFLINLSDFSSNFQFFRFPKISIF